MARMGSEERRAMIAGWQVEDDKQPTPRAEEPEERKGADGTNPETSDH